VWAPVRNLLWRLCGLSHVMHCGVQGIIPVEGLLLEEVPPGVHQLHCLPLKVVGSDGAPVRCIITVS